MALALSLAIAEARVADRWRPEWDRVTRHFAFLEAHGYTVSDAVREELEIAERAEYQADQAELAEEQGEDADRSTDALAQASSSGEEVTE